MRRLTAGLAVALAALSGSAAGAEAPGIGATLEKLSASVVPVRYTLRPQEAPSGGEGEKVEKVVCGLLVSDDGLVVIPGDPFPDPGGDPRLTLEPVAFAVLGSGETEHPAAPVGFDRDLNLGYVRLSGPIPAGLSPVRFEPDPQIRIGQEVWIVGLLAERYGYAPAFWPGRVNAAVEKPRRMFSLTVPVIDLAIGGLVATPDGRVLGLVGEDVLPPPRSPGDLPENALLVFGSFSQGPRVGYPMLFPAPLFSASMASPPPLESRPSRSWLGITMQPLSRRLASYWKIEGNGGVIVTGVLDGSPASSAGLTHGDVIVALAGAPIFAREDSDLPLFRQQVERLAAGQPVALRVWRAGEFTDVTIQPEIAPRTSFLAEEYRDEAFGLTVREVTFDFIQAQNLPVDTVGVVISELESAGWAEVAGLEPGDLVLRVDDAPTRDLASFRTALEQARDARRRQVRFFVQRGVETQFFSVRTDW
jgi:membrane-associated protease RseP (regulator of RpoE activity)